ncbi:diguanylate cyclase (GGDEF)-like protein/PAS domain S-box-containing protein [Actimicrobium sp. GrIS 1.19]|uniref:diguanylate cyclase domain-containing protein n=1 Tax=Actimicrobium sp. GrIS 1.19 TaxID=3071708 RepID=UPI002DFDA30B|nr:diguanylate cyclase (GGDEF)-like protein/PAS domain S-box-containing protein [Actimicrobium sp. GrIS 1.19]
MRVRRHLNNISVNLAFWFCLSSILLTCILSEIIGRVASDSVNVQLREKLADIAFQTTDKLDQGLFERYREVQLMASRYRVGEPAMSLATMQSMIDQAQDTYSDYAWIGVANVNGTVIASTKGILAGANVAARPWFSNAMRGASNVMDLHEAKMLATKLAPAPSGEPLRFVDVAFPLVAPNGALEGVLGAHLSWEWARKIEQSVITPSMRRSHIEAMILDSSGKVLLGPPSVQGSTLRLPGLAAVERAGVSSAVEHWPDQRDYLVGYSKSRGHPPFPGFGWTVLVRQDAVEAFAPVRLIQQKVLWTGGLIALLFSLIGIVNARRISRPLVTLAREVLRFRTGETTRLEVPAGAYREITELSISFIVLVRDLEQNEAALQGLNASLEQRVSRRTAELAASEDRLRQILEHSHDAFIAIGGQGEVTDWNREAEQTFGWSATEAAGRNLAELIIPPAMRGAHAAGFAQFLQTGQGPALNTRIEVVGMHRDGHAIPIEISIAGFHNGSGYVANAFLRDITERKAAEQTIRDSEQRLQAITDHLPVLISYIDQQHVFRFANANFKAWLGLEPDLVLGQHCRAILGEALYEQRRPNIERALRGEQITFDIASTVLGVERHMHTIYVPAVNSNGVIGGIYTLTSDVSELKAAEQRMAVLARHDTLTGLPNRYQLDEKLFEAVRRCQRSGLSMAVMFLDIDHFKQINDTRGHASGDAVLQEFGRRLQKSVRVTDTVARLAGDEFIVVLEGLHTAQEAEAVAGKMLHSVAAPVEVGDTPLHITTSIGIAYTDGSYLNPADLMAHADAALYEAKAQGRNRYFCAYLSDSRTALPVG